MTKRRIEIFVAGCALCEEAVKHVRERACESCEIAIRDMKVADDARRARELGVRQVPAVAVDGALLSCCAGGIDDDALRDAGVGSPR